MLVILQRRHEYWTVLMALSKIGAIAIPATHMLMEKDLVYRMRKAGTKAVVAVNEDELCENIRKAAARVPETEKLVCIGKRDGFLDLTEGTERAEETLNVSYRGERSAEDILLIYFTSGTTGMPKMVTLTGVSIITADHGNAEHMLSEDGTPFTAHTTNLVPCCLVGADVKLRDGRLADLAPTMLDLMGLSKPEEMTGETLIVH